MKKPFLKRLKQVALASGVAAGLLSFTGCKSAPQGLYAEDGQLMRGGEEFKAMGINYCSSFLNLLKDKEEREFVEGFRILK